MAMKTQGSQLYVLLPTEADPLELEVVNISCTGAITLAGSPKDQLEDTCLEETSDRTYMQGLGTPAAATVNLQADPRNASHIRLYQLYQSGDVVKFALGWSDGKNISPTLNVDGDDFSLPNTRTWNVFQGYVSDFPFDIAQNAMVATAATIQRSGGSVWIKKSA